MSIAMFSVSVDEINRSVLEILDVIGGLLRGANPTKKV